MVGNNNHRDDESDDDGGGTFLKEFLDLFLSKDALERLENGNWPGRQECCGTSRCLYCTECFRLLLLPNDNVDCCNENENNNENYCTDNNINDDDKRMRALLPPHFDRMMMMLEGKEKTSPSQSKPPPSASHQQYNANAADSKKKDSKNHCAKTLCFINNDNDAQSSSCSTTGQTTTTLWHDENDKTDDVTADSMQLQSFPPPPLPFDLHIILHDRRKSASGLHAKVLFPSQTSLFDVERDDAIPNYAADLSLSSQKEQQNERYYLLFPSSTSVPLSSIVKDGEDNNDTSNNDDASTTKTTTKAITLIVLDCKWTQPSILQHPHLQGLQHVHLSSPSPVSYSWRWHNAGPGRLSTIEAIYHAAREVHDAATTTPRQQGDSNGIYFLSILLLFGWQRAMIFRDATTMTKRPNFRPRANALEESEKQHQRSLRKQAGTKKQEQDRQHGRQVLRHEHRKTWHEKKEQDDQLARKPRWYNKLQQDEK